MVQVDYRYLRPKKAAALQQWYDEPLAVRQELKLWQGDRAAILPLRSDPALLFGQGGVVDQEGNYVELSGLPLRIEGGYPFENAPYRDEKVVYCGYLIAHWGHFLVEAVARLWYFLEQDPTVDKYVFFLKEGENRQITGNYREFLELLGIWDKLEFITVPTVYRQVIVPELSFRCRSYYSPQFLAIFDTVASHAPALPAEELAERIYFSRSQLKKGNGNEFGMEVLDDFYRRNGYHLLYPERVPLSKMIGLIRATKVIATVSGSLPHNALFAKPGQNLVILERCVPNNDFQVCVNRIRQLHATYIDANIALYPVDMVGPFIMGYTPQLEAYAQEGGMVPPSSELTSQVYLDRCFKSYMRAYQRLYRYQWFMADWYAGCADYLLEAYQQGEALFAPYLTGSRPFLPEHYFQWHYWKQFVKRILRKVGLR